jgi:hypothetical protein
MMEKDLFDIIREKSFEELSAEERTELSEMATDADTYAELKVLMEEVDLMASEKVVPSVKIKGDLDSLFEEVHAQRKYAWYMSFAAVIVPKDKPIRQQPLFYAAAVLLLALLVVPFANRNLADTSDVLADNTLVQEESVSRQKNDMNMEVPVSTNVETRTMSEQSKSEVVMKDASAPSELVPMEAEFAEVVTMEDELAEMESDANVTTMFAAPTATSVASKHPDGVFEDWAAESSFSVPASKQPELLDLLTTTF